MATDRRRHHRRRQPSPARPPGAADGRTRRSAERRVATSIITAMIGTEMTPFTTAAHEQRANGIERREAANTPPDRRATIVPA